MAPAAWQELVQEPADAQHVVQLYRDTAFLAAAASAWCARVLRDGGGAILFGTTANARAITQALQRDGVDTRALAAEGRLVIVDAHEILATCVPDGRVDARKFQHHVRALVARMRSACAEGSDVRAWGELVNVLHERGDAAAAHRLEVVWNDILGDEDVRLLCSYRVDNLSDAAHAGTIRDLCGSHEHLIPEPDYEAFERAVSRALVSLFGEEEAWAMRRALEARVPVETGMPSGEAVLLALHDTHPELGARMLHAVRRYSEPGVAE